MNAEEARQKVAEYNSQRVDRILCEIDEKVKYAAAWGYSATAYDVSRLSAYDIGRLKVFLVENGFRVQVDHKGRMRVAW